MQHNNFQKKPVLSNFLIIPVSPPVHGTVHGHLSSVASCPIPHRDTDENPPLTGDGQHARPARRHGRFAQIFFFFDANMNTHISVLYFQRVLHSIEFFKTMHHKKYRYIGCVLMHNCLNHCN